MAGTEIDDLESYHEGILKKYEFSGISSLTPSEICLTLLSPSWEYFFFKTTKTHWLSVVSNYKPILVSYMKATASENLKAKDQESLALRQQAGRKFLELLDNISISNAGTISDPSLKDDHIVERLKELLSKKSISLINLLLKNDSNHDGFMSKSEFITALEEIGMMPQDIVALIRIAGYRPGVDRIPVAGFSEFLSKRSDDRKKEEYALFTKVLTAFNSKDKNLSKVFAFLDANKDGVVTLDEMRQGLSSMSVNLSLAECKEVFAVLDKDRSGSISLDELKKRLSTLSSGGHEVKGSDSNKLNGTLEVNILKGQKFKAGAKTIKVKFGSTEYTSGSSNDANPEWKFKNTFEVNNQALQSVPREVEFEVFSGKKSEGKAVVLLSDIRNIDVYKGKLDIQVNKQSHGIVLVKCTWNDIQSAPVSERGNLSLALIRGDNITSDFIASLNDNHLILSSKTLGQTLRIEKIKKTVDGVLKITKHPDGPSKDLSLGDIINEDKRSPYEVIIEKTKLYIQILWEEFDPEDEKEDVAATKIQAAWRGYSVRNNSRIKCPRKLILKKTATYEGRRYILIAYQGVRGLQIEVHPGDSTQVGLDTVLSLNEYPMQDPNDLLAQVNLKADMTLGSLLEKKTVRGTLNIELVQCRNLPSALLHFSIRNTSASISTSKPEKAVFESISFNKPPPEVKCRVFHSASKELVAECGVFWTHAIMAKGKWTSNSVVYIGEQASIIIKTKWEELEDISKEEEAAILIQKNWRAKNEKEELKIRMRKNTLVGRRGITKGNRIFLVSVLDEPSNYLIQLHPADNPQVPTFEIIDKVTVGKDTDIEELFKKISVEDNKIKLN